MIRIHKEGKLIIAISLLIFAVINVLAFHLLNYLFFYIISFATIALLILILRFFRVPDRRRLSDDRMIIAPADGKVVAIEKTMVNEFLEEERIQVSIFMSIHDVHINYYPMAGTVIYTQYHPGRYLVARHPKSSSLNEHHSIALKNASCTLLVKQIAGFVARRIKCYASEGTQVEQGDELGFIKFGSRVDLFLPLDAEILVSLNETTIGGITPLARLI
jgi:phosphatidylserine decarboxylase